MHVVAAANAVGWRRCQSPKKAPLAGGRGLVSTIYVPTSYSSLFLNTNTPDAVNPLCEPVRPLELQRVLALDVPIDCRTLRLPQTGLTAGHRKLPRTTALPAPRRVPVATGPGSAPLT